MGSDKTYIFDGGGTGGGLDIAALVSSMMSNKGMDPNLVAALMNGNNNRGSWGGDGGGSGSSCSSSAGAVTASDSEATARTVCLRSSTVTPDVNFS